MRKHLAVLGLAAAVTGAAPKLHAYRVQRDGQLQALGAVALPTGLAASWPSDPTIEKGHTMSQRRSILIGSTIVAGGLLWYLFRPDALVISKTVNEPFPAAQASESAMGESSMGSSTGASPGMAHSSIANSSAMGESHEADPVRLVSGRFHTNAHETKGLATIYVLDDGRRVLRLTEFSTSNGPDVRVYLVAGEDVNEEDAAKQAGILDLGALKGNIGDQNYDVPEGLDLTKYRAVSIWCRRFSVNFGAAPLTETM